MAFYGKKQVQAYWVGYGAAKYALRKQDLTKMKNNSYLGESVKAGARLAYGDSYDHYFGIKTKKRGKR